MCNSYIGIYIYFIISIICKYKEGIFFKEFLLNTTEKFSNAKVIASNKNPTDRTFLESFYSKNDQNSFNRYIECSEIYDSIVNIAIDV